MNRIYWDAMLFIYWLEDAPKYADRVRHIHLRMQERSDRLIASAFTFGEVLAGVYRKGASQLGKETVEWMQSLVDEVVPFTAETAEQYGRIRASLRVTPADAIQLACAAQAGTDLFMTNDKKLVGKFVPGIRFIASLDTQLY